MERSSQFLHGIRRVCDGWEVWSQCLQFPVRCGSAADAKLMAMALEEMHLHGPAVDYSEVDAAMESTRQPNLKIIG
jgi:hypothetical protein